MSKVDISSFQDEMGIDRKTLKELYSVFSEEISSEIEKMKNEFKNMLINEMKATIHNIKGVSGNFKAVDVHTKASQINDLIKSDKFEGLEELINELSTTIESSVNEIEIFFETEE